MEKNTYKQNVLCINCNFKDVIDIVKGIKIEEAKCPNCGNDSLERDDPIHTTSYSLA